MKLEQLVKEKSAELTRLETELKDSGLDKSASQLENENTAMKAELDSIEEKIAKIEKRKQEKLAESKVVDPKEKKAVEKDYEKYLAAYKKRKAMCRDMIDTVMESYPGSKKKLLDDIGIETDEDALFEFKAPQPWVTLRF